MRFLIDENIPVNLVKTLRKLGHDAVRVQLTSDDWSIARKALKEERILVTQDKDFISSVMRSGIGVIHVQVLPANEDTIIDAFLNLLDNLLQEKFEGLVILKNDRHFHIP
jgi:predicted nuclease of predicted toxin-antitoxin system